jgi:hypothetical protein
MSYLNTKTKQFIRSVENMGETITLSDNSKWKVGMFDKTKSMMWMMMDDVVVADGFLNKHKITHLKRNETVEAEFIQK